MCCEQTGSRLLLDLVPNESQRAVRVFAFSAFFYSSALDWSAALTAFGDARLDVDHI